MYMYSAPSRSWPKMGSRLAGATHHLQWPPTPFWKALRVYLSYGPGEVDGRAAVRPCGGGKHFTTTAPASECHHPYKKRF